MKHATSFTRRARLLLVVSSCLGSVLASGQPVMAADGAVPPRITDFSPRSGTNGTVVTLTGTNFSLAAASNTVYFGAVRAQVKAADATNLAVLVPPGATYSPITVTVGGLVAAAPTPFQPTFTGGNSALSAASFAPRFDLPGGDGAHRSAIADLDGDGKPDIAVANVYGHTVCLFRNISNPGELSGSSFAPRVDLAAVGGTSDNPYGFGAADVDGDGKLDLVACDRLGNNISIYRNLATPGSLTADSFAGYVNFPVGADPRYARVVDLDGDGRPDIVSCNYAANTISILRNIGTAGALDTNSFAPRVDLPAGVGPYDVAVGDLDGDGKPDLAVVNTDGFSVSVYRNLATPGTLDTNSFAPRVDFPARDGNDTIMFGDIDGDGKPDLVIGSFKSYSMSVYRNQATPGSLDTNSFAARVDFATGNWTHNVALADLNGDGKTDIVTVGELESYVSIFQNLSTPGNFTTASLGSRFDLGAGWNGWGITAGDLDGDGRPDLVFCNAYDDTVSIYRNIAPFGWEATSPAFIATQPVDQQVLAGYTASFGVVAAGPGLFTYQWRFEGGPIDGATNDSLMLPNVQLSQAGAYSVAVSNAFGGVVSSNALLTVLAVPPSIAAQPQDRAVYEGRTATFSVAVNGSIPFSYQWSREGVTLVDATRSSLTLTNVQYGDAGLYGVVITNSFGSVTSRLATLTVRPAPVCVPVPAGAVAWWPGQSNTWDVIGGFDGLFVQVQPPAYLYTEGKVGAALRFTGGPFIQVSNGGGLDLGAREGLTLEGWIRPDVTGLMPIAEWNDGAGLVGAGLLLGSVGPGLLEATLRDINPSVRSVTFRSAAYAVTNLAWQHVALTYDRPSGLAVIYVNGLPVAQTNAGTMRLSTASDFFIGYRRSGSYSGSRFRGALDEITLYERALTGAEIQAIVAADEAGKCPPPPPPCVTPPTGIAAWWRGESNTVDSVAGNHGQMVPTNYPAALSYQPGQVDTAFAFRGPNFVAVPRSDILDLGTERGLTIEAWIYPNQSRPMPIVEWTDTNGFGANLWLSYSRGPTVLEANLIDTTGGYHLIQSPVNTLGYNLWQHVALTYDKASGAAALYVNGNLVTTTNLGSFAPKTDLPLLLGYHPPNTASPSGYGSPPASPFFFSGAMDEMALYSRALNPGEIRSLARVRPGKCLNLPPAIASGPQDQVAAEGATAAFTVAAGGSAPLSYQWYAAGQAIAGATGATLLLASVKPGDAGGYSVVVSNGLGVAVSRVAALAVLPAHQCVPTPFGAVAFWRGESNTVDELGNHPAAWGTNTVGEYTSAKSGGGKVNTAFRFTGINYLQVAGNRDLDVGSGGGFTVEGWFKPDSYGGPQPIVDWNDNRGNVGVGIMYSRTGPGTLEVTMTDTGATLTQDRTVTFVTANHVLGAPTNPAPPWAHIALTFDRVTGKATLFVNGRPVAGRAIGMVTSYSLPYGRVPFTPATTGNLYFGWRPTGLYSGPRYRGAMDEMTVYCRVLAPLEVQAIYAAGSNGKCTPQTSCWPVTADVAGWWRGELNLQDSINTNHGIPVGLSPVYTNGVAGAALWLTPFTGRYVRIPAAPALDIGAGNGLTFEAWVNPDLNLASYTVAAWNTGNGEQGISFGSSLVRGPYYFEANLVDAAGNSHVMTAPYRAVTNGIWQHVAVTYSPASCLGVIYVNGSPLTVTNLGLFTPRTTGNLYLGYRPPGSYPGGGWGYGGGLDEVMIHASALSAGEITLSYRNAANRCMTPPFIVQQPASVRVNAGSDVTLSVVAAGNPVLRYQWYRNGRPVYDGQQKPAVSATQPSLTLTNVAKWNQGVYSVVVSNAFGVAVSSNATLLVNYPPAADASATVPLLISPNGRDAVAVLDGTRSSDPDHDPLACQWFLAGAGAPLATGLVAVVTLPVGTNAIQLVVSDGLLARTNQVVVEVITTAEATDRLIAIVQSGTGNPGPLVASLRAALASIDRSQPATAINQVEAFIRKIHAQLEPLDPALAAQLIAEAQAIIDALNGGGAGAQAVQITALGKAPQGNPHLKILAPHGRICIIETSTDMVNWVKIGVARGSGGREYEFDDVQTPAGEMRFYRVVSP